MTYRVKVRGDNCKHLSKEYTFLTRLITNLMDTLRPLRGWTGLKLLVIRVGAGAESPVFNALHEQINYLSVQKVSKKDLNFFFNV